MGMKKCKNRGKIILVPYPAQGHVTPMFQLASAILSHGYDPVVVVPEFIHGRVVVYTEKEEISCISIPDGLDKDEAQDFFTIEKAMENIMPGHMERIIKQEQEQEEEEEEGRVIICMVVDLVASWGIEVGNRCGIPVAGFWPAMLATFSFISDIPHLIHTGYVSPHTGCAQAEYSSEIYLPNQPIFSTEDLPWLIGTPAARKSRFQFWNRTLGRTKTLRWLLVNSFPEEYYLPDMNTISKQTRTRSPLHHQQLSVFSVGPLSKHATNTKNPSLWEEDMSCLEWLDEQTSNSVMYISFGSWVGPIREESVNTLALTLENLGVAFIWVLGFGWREGLSCGYVERVSKSKQGKIVTWAPQTKVLQHKSVGCYLTHCGWNSTMEAIQSQKPLLCYPIAGDQFVNCAYIVKVWKIGIRINGFEKNDVKQGLKQLMEDPEINGRLMRLYNWTLGNDANLRVMANLSTFIDDLKYVHSQF